MMEKRTFNIASAEANEYANRQANDLGKCAVVDARCREAEQFGAKAGETSKPIEYPLREVSDWS